MTSSNAKPRRETGECDTVLSKCITHGYDEFNRLTSRTVTWGTAQNYTYVYDRYGNRWQQNALNGDFNTQLTFTASTNQIATNGYAYDAAGNMTNDGFHTYTYDAEGNVTAIDSGTTARYTCDALNNRVRVDQGTSSTEFVFNLNGQRASYWNASNGAQIQGQTYWGSAPVEFYEAGYAQFQHQDWMGTERMRSDNAGPDGMFLSLPFGDGFSTLAGVDNDAYHFGMLDHDYSRRVAHPLIPPQNLGAWCRGQLAGKSNRRRLRGFAEIPSHWGYLDRKSMPNDPGPSLPAANVWRWRWYVGVQAGSTIHSSRFCQHS